MKESTSFKCKDSVTLDLDSLIAKVKIESSNDSKVVIQSKSDDKTLSELKITQMGDTISIRGCENLGTFSSNNVSIGNFSGGSISSGNISFTNVNNRNIVINGDAIYIDGKRVDVQDGGNLTNREPLELIISIPSGLKTDLNLGMLSELESNIEINEVSLDSSGQNNFILSKVAKISGDVSGQTKIHVNQILKELDLELSGQSTINVAHIEGHCELSAIGQSYAKIKGKFSSIKASCSGQSRINTYGTVSGNALIKTRGMAHFDHTGDVIGTVKKKASGMSSISFN